MRYLPILAASIFAAGFGYFAGYYFGMAGMLISLPFGLLLGMFASQISSNMR